MKILRDVRAGTKVLILLEILDKPHFTLKPLAKNLGITIQGMSEYMKILKGEDMVQKSGRRYTATRKGVQFLHENIRALRDFAHGATGKLNIIRQCSAMAGNDICEGERVGLFMENGTLKAYSGKRASSTGIALMDACEDEDIGIDGLEGIVKFELGNIIILELPSINEGGTRTLNLTAVKEQISQFNGYRVGVMDVVGLALAKKIGVEVDLELLSSASFLETAQRGVDIVILGSTESSYGLLSVADKINAKLEEKIHCKVISPDQSQE